jgi:ubiquinone/menaquinone biosynthesis C-methylase UbiE
MSRQVPAAPSPVTHWDDIDIDYDQVLNSDPSNVALLTTAVELLPGAASDVLDIGSGTGRLTAMCRAALPDARLVGIDPAASMLAVARSKFFEDQNVSFEPGVVQDLSQFGDESFDAVITSFVLHHLDLGGYPVAAGEIHRVLRPGGRFINADQFCRVMGPAGSVDRAMDILELLTEKAKYYLREASFERMLLQVDLLPRFMREQGEILTTGDHWREILLSAGFGSVDIFATHPVELYNQVILAVKPGRASPAPVRQPGPASYAGAYQVSRRLAKR